MAQANKSALNQSPYERQLKAGFGTLVFERRLEEVFRQRHRASVAALLRVSLVIGLLFVGLQAALDYKLLPAEFHRWSLGLSAGVVLPAIILGLMLSAKPQRAGLMAIGSILVTLALGASFLILENLGTTHGVPSRFAGFLAITFYMYYLLGLLFWQALLTGLLLAGGFVAAGLLGGLPSSGFTYQLLYLGFSNLVGILGLYTLERTRRMDFLRENALDFRVGHDGLTGLRNRQSFDEKFDVAWRDAKRESKPLSLLMIDIDYFKHYNDVYGHQAGDNCLKTVAKVLGPIARRPLDFVGRYGGEEFVVMLSGSVEQYAVEAAEHIRAQIEALKIPHSGSKVSGVITTSIGLAHLNPGESERSKEGFLQLADEALYRAKDRGRNQVVRSAGEDKNIQTGLFRREVGQGL